MLPALNISRHCGEYSAWHSAEGFGSLVAGCPPAQSTISLGMLGAGKTWAITWEVTVPPGGPQQVFFHFC